MARPRRGRFAFYAHQQPGNPLGLAVGQTFRRSQVIGRLGNSGNGSSPHLHFHVMERPDPLAANGLPFAFDSFVLEGRVASEESMAAGTFGPGALHPSEHLVHRGLPPAGLYAVARGHRLIFRCPHN